MRAVVFCWAGGQPCGLAAGPKHLSPFTRFLIANGIPFEPIVMTPLRGKTAFQGLYLYHFEGKAFLMRRGDGRACPAGGRALTAAASPVGWPPAQNISLHSENF